MPESWRRDIDREITYVSRPPESRWSAARRWASERVGLTVGELLWANFISRVPGGRVLLLFLTVVGLGAAAIRSGDTRPLDTTRGIWRRRIAWLSGGSALLSVALNEFVLASVVTADGALSASSVFVIRITQLALLSVATVLMAFRSTMAGIIDRLRVTWSAARAESASVLAVSIAVPWALLFLVSDGERRYWWIWPLQVTVLAAAVTYVPTRLGVTRWVVRLASIGLMIVVMANTVLLSRLNDWLQHGWSGRDAVEVEATDRLAERIKGSGSNRAFIGYEIEIWRFMAASNIADRRYKAGANFDLLLRSRHGIENLNVCAEGMSSDDQYRLVQTQTRDPLPSGQNRMNSSRSNGFKLVDRLGIYDIFQRN